MGMSVFVHLKFKLVIFVLTLVFTILSNHRLLAQDTLDVDKAFLQARDLAFKGKRAEARQLARRILSKNPGYTDVKILMGRTFTWDKQYDSARVILEPLVQSTPPSQDALQALIDLETWSDNPQKALQYADMGITQAPGSMEFKLKKARALKDLQNYPAATTLINQLLQQNPGNGDILQLANMIRTEASGNSVSATYQYDAFDKGTDPWHAATLAYSRRTKIGTITGRVNYARRFNNNGTLFEVDAYPSLGKKMYAFINAGVSGTGLFPKVRSGVSVYRNLPKSFEAELGVRYLRFSSNTFIYTGSISKYLGSFWFSLRPFITPGDLGISQSYFFLTRYYLSNANDYITLTLGSGFSPDDNSKDVALINTTTLQSKKIRLDVQKGIKNRTLVSALIGYDRQEYLENTFRNNLTLSVGIQQLF